MTVISLAVGSCVVDGCETPAKAWRGMCYKHYTRVIRHGDPSIVLNDTGQTLEERMERRIERTETCWLWTGYIAPTGYGLLTVNRRPRLAHRLSYQLTHGCVLVPAQVLDHLCLVRNCVNPAHLEIVTGAENTRRWFAGQTHCKHGHEFTAENTWIRIKPDGATSRQCRTCNREQVRRWKQANPERWAQIQAKARAMQASRCIGDGPS